jgi:hypothetical protein
MSSPQNNRSRETADRVAAEMLRERRQSGDNKTTFEQMKNRVGEAFRIADNKRKG